MMNTVLKFTVAYGLVVLFQLYFADAGIIRTPDVCDFEIDVN